MTITPPVIVRDIIDRRALPPKTWGMDSTSQSPVLYEKRLAIIVGAVLAVLLLATLLMIGLVGSDFRRRRRSAGGDAVTVISGPSFFRRLCPRCLSSAKSEAQVGPAGRPLPPLPHSEGMIELPPSILNTSDIILVESV